MRYEEIGDFTIRLEHGDDTSWHVVEHLGDVVRVGEDFSALAEEDVEDGVDLSEALARAEHESMRLSREFVYAERDKAAQGA